jgi:hypothetical protein
MTREDIISMAREQGLPETGVEGVFRVNTDDLGRFAALVEERTHTNNKARWYQEGVEAEREACAKLAEEPYEFTSEEAHRIAASIRARANDTI